MWNMVRQENRQTDLADVYFIPVGDYLCRLLLFRYTQVINVSSQFRYFRLCRLDKTPKAIAFPAHAVCLSFLLYNPSRKGSDYSTVYQTLFSSAMSCTQNTMSAQGSLVVYATRRQRVRNGFVLFLHLLPPRAGTRVPCYFTARSKMSYNDGLAKLRSFALESSLAQ